MTGQERKHDNYRVEHALRLTCIVCSAGLVISCLNSCGSSNLKTFKSSTEYVITGNEFFKMGDYFNAEQNYREALRKDPGNATAKNNLGVILNEQGNYPQAIA